MLYYWWLFSIMTPIAMLDVLVRTSPLYYAASWPLGLSLLAEDY